MKDQKIVRTEVIGIPVTASGLTAVTNLIIDLSRKKKSGYVCVANVHMLVTAVRDTGFSDIMENASVVVPDGMPLVWDMKRQGYNEIERISGYDLLDSICQKAQEERISVYFYGAHENVLKGFLARTEGRYPSLIISGAEAAPVLPERPAVDNTVVAKIRSSGANIVFVGLGCPKQEYWMKEYTNKLDAVLIGVGAAFDFHAGTKRRAPKWMQKSGLEWLYRLGKEPKRLWKRYLITNSYFICYWVLTRTFGLPKGRKIL